MTKREFLEILRQSLAGEVSLETIEQNVTYYDQYIASQTDEANAIDNLGDPRLIAKTIIETEKAARQKGRYTGTQSSYSDYREPEENQYSQQGNEKHGNGIFITNLKWYHKLVLALIILLLFVVIAFIGSIIIRFLFVFLIPILIIWMLVTVFRRR
jgi:Flp pilus assembly protein TadB